MSSLFSPRTTEQEENHWLSVSDLMAGLMVVFLFIAIALMRDALITASKMREVAVAYQQGQVDIYNALQNEFENDLERWNAVIDRDSLTFTFDSPEVLFGKGEIVLSDTYRQLLADFFPRYMHVLEPYKEVINEIRLEGHTSSVWSGSKDETDAYFRNMELSQGRTRSVLDYVYSLDNLGPYRDWIKRNIAAVGFSSAKAVVVNGREDELKSQRVSFRVITNADIRIKQILEVDE
jgi:outer membrane protein OmpA-like peptidoglycan-associated protein